MGSHWLNRVGIVAVLVGVSLFLKYAFEGKWVGPPGRISIRHMAGIAVIIWSESFRAHKYHIFSFLEGSRLRHAVPIAVGRLPGIQLAFLDCSLHRNGYGHYLDYYIALWQEAEILALFALIGGFATPLLLYTGENREVQLIAYLALLNSATLLLVGTALGGVCCWLA